MRRYLSVAVLLCILSTACEKPVMGTAYAGVELNPHTRRIKLKGTGTTKDSGPQPMMGAGASLGTKGEWNHTAEFAASGGDVTNPYIVVRCFDGTQGAVRVEVTFKGNPIPNLRVLTFDHVTRSENFRIKTSGGTEQPYNGKTQKGEALELQVPSGDAVVTFLAWPHVH